MMFQNAWVSDRTVCYLASGKPAVVQDTCELVPAPRGGAVPVHVRGAGRRRVRRDQQGLHAPLPRGSRHRGDLFRRRAGPGTRLERRAGPVRGERVVSVTVCLAPANTVAYPNGGGHLWVYLHWALALKALGCRVIWLEGLDVDERDASPAARGRGAARGGAAAARGAVGAVG